MSEQHEKFLSRWSRLKQSPPLTPSAEDVPAKVESALPQLPPVEDLTFDSKFSDFMHPKVEQVLKRAALKKLFSDPHFNVMDGLDTYIDDYSKGEELPASMLAQMKSAQKIFRWARNEADEPEEVAEESAALEQEPVAQSLLEQPALPETPEVTPMDIATEPVPVDAPVTEPANKS